MVRNKLIKLFLLLMMVFLVVSGLAILKVALLPLELVSKTISVFSPLDQPVERAVFWLRVSSFCLFLMGLSLYMMRKTAYRFLREVLSSFFCFLSEVKFGLVKVLKKEGKVHLLAFLTILVLAVILRIFFLFQPMRSDEAFSFTYYSSKPFLTALSSYSYPNNHLFHTGLVRFAYLLFGNKPWVIRLPAFLSGILIIPASYLAVRLFYNGYAALLTAGLIASSTAFIGYSTNARGYTLVCLFFLVILVLGKYLLQSRNLAVWMLFAILSTLGFYTIPIMLYPFGIVIVWLFFSAALGDTSLNQNLFLKDLIFWSMMVVFFTFLLYLPAFIVTGWESVVANRFVTSQSWSYFVGHLPDFFKLVWADWNNSLPLGVSLFLSIGFFVFLFFHKRLTKQRVSIVLVAVVWCFTLLVIQRVIPFARVWLFLLPLYIGFSSSGVSLFFGLIKPGASRFGSLTFTVIAMMLSFWLSSNVVRMKAVYEFNKWETLKDAEQITFFLKGHLEAGDLVYGAPRPILIYYFNLYNVPVEYLFSDLDSSRRILVVIDKAKGQTLEGILEEEKLLGSNFGAPKLVQKYESAALYEINRNE